MARDTDLDAVAVVRTGDIGKWLHGLAVHPANDQITVISSIRHQVTDEGSRGLLDVCAWMALAISFDPRDQRHQPDEACEKGGDVSDAFDQFHRELTSTRGPHLAENA